jgi:hypothetical protein
MSQRTTPRLSALSLALVVGLAATLVSGTRDAHAAQCLIQSGNDIQFIPIKARGAKAGGIKAKDCTSEGTNGRAGSIVSERTAQRIKEGNADLNQGNDGAGPLPDDWFDIPLVCASVPRTRDNDSQNRVVDVKTAQAVELALSIAYDIGSGEPSGIAGAVLGAILGISRAVTFSIEWKYDLQAECQDNWHAIQVEAIADNLGIVFNTVQSVAAQLPANNAEVSGTMAEIRSTLGALGASLPGGTDAPRAVLVAVPDAAQSAAIATSPADATESGHGSVGGSIASLDDIDTAVYDLHDSYLRLTVEQHLQSCNPLVTMVSDLPPPAGLFTETLDILDDLIAGAELSALDVGDAPALLDQARADYGGGMTPRAVWPGLCAAYEELTKELGAK